MRIEQGHLYRCMAGEGLAKQAAKAPEQPDAMRERVEKYKNEHLSSLESARRPFASSKQQMDEEKDKMDVALTCMVIARRISGGDKVPAADHQYLLKHDPALYARSTMMRFTKNNPYEYKRFSKEERCKESAGGRAAECFEIHGILKDALAQTESLLLSLDI